MLELNITEDTCVYECTCMACNGDKGLTANPEDEGQTANSEARIQEAC